MQNSSCVRFSYTQVQRVLYGKYFGENEAKMSAMKNIYYDLYPMGTKEELV